MASGRWRGLASAISLLGAACSAPRSGVTADAAPARPLPAPALADSHVLRVLQLRHTERDFSPEALPAQLVADVLWAAGGVNRTATGQRTAPTAHDWRYVDVYVFDAHGVSLYDPDHHALRPLAERDLRPLTGLQELAATAPLSLVYVADDRRMGKGLDGDTRRLYADASVGAMFENVYAFCAEQGLATGVRADIDRRALGKAMGLSPQQRIVMAQSVGRPVRRTSGGADAH